MGPIPLDTVLNIQAPGSVAADPHGLGEICSASVELKGVKDKVLAKGRRSLFSQTLGEILHDEWVGTTCQNTVCVAFFRSSRWQ